MGPIPESKGTVTLARRPSNTAFRTTGTSAWPPRLCSEIAKLLQASFDRSPQISLEKHCDDKTVAPLEQRFFTYFPCENYWKGRIGAGGKIRLRNKTFSFKDGCGPTSPEHFDKGKRTYPSGRRWVLLRRELTGVNSLLDELAVQKQLVALALSRENLFDHSWPTKMGSILHAWMKRQSGDYERSEVPQSWPDNRSV